MRPIVSFYGSPTYQLSKHLAKTLKPLTDASDHKLQSTENFIDAIKTVQIPNNHRLVSFDVKSLFTSIPLQLTLDCTGTLFIQQTADDTPLPLPNDKIMDLLKLCLESTFFQYNGRHCKQLHGTAIGSPVSVVVDEIVMQHIEKRALATYDQTLHFWFRYVDDTITILQTDDIDVFHGHLNRQNSDIQFTRELEDNGKLPCVPDCLVSRDDTRLRTTVYHKPTHTDRLLDQSSYNPTLHRATTVRTLTRRAQIICDSADSLRDENEHLRQIFHKNDYSDEFIDTNKYKQNKQNDECANTETKNELRTVSLPYIRGTSETIARILKPFNIRIAHKPTRTLLHLLTNVKDKVDPKDRQGTVYRIRCNDCNGTYIGETGRTLTTRLGEHQTATDKEDLTNNIAQHHRKTGHDINWDSATCLTHSTDKDQRLTLESWFTNLQPNPLNRSRKLPAAYERLLQSEYRTADENAN